MPGTADLATTSNLGQPAESTSPGGPGVAPRCIARWAAPSAPRRQGGRAAAGAPEGRLPEPWATIHAPTTTRPDPPDGRCRLWSWCAPTSRRCLGGWFMVSLATVIVFRRIVMPKVGRIRSERSNGVHHPSLDHNSSRERQGGGDADQAERQKGRHNDDL